MSAPDQTLREELRERIGDCFANSCRNNEYFGNDGWYELHTPTLKHDIEQLVNAEVLSVLDRLEQSINQHTVPEGIGLVTRSYVQNSIDFERRRYE